MKKINDLLLSKSGKQMYCLKNTTMFWEQTNRFFPTPGSWLLCLSLPFVTLLIGLNSHPFEAASSNILVVSCNEFLFKNNDEPNRLSFPKFDPALGTLRGVEITTESTTIADVEEKNIRGNNYSLGLNITLTAGIPALGEKILRYQPQFRRTLRTENTASGLSTQFSETQKSTEIITENLTSYIGKGELSIPLKVEGLVNFKNGTSAISSHIKTKLCISYQYD